jgi:hypothetical protein
MKYYYKNLPDKDKEMMNLYNKIYKRDGFIGIIQNLKEAFEKGVVENLNGLYKITIDDSYIDNVIIDALLHPKSSMLKHYKGFICDNSYYFSEEPCDEVEMVNVTKLEDEEFEERTRKALKQVENNPNRKILTIEEFLKYISIN